MKYFSGVWANQRLDKVISVQFWLSWVLLVNFALQLSSHGYIGINSETYLFSRLWKSKNKKAATGRAKTKQAGWRNMESLY